MSGKSLGRKRVLKTSKEKEHTLESEAVNLYKYLITLFEKTMGKGTEENIEKMDDMIYNLMKSIKIKSFKIISPLIRSVFNRKKRNAMKKDKMILKRK